jgi:hypothetical protein
MKLEAQPIELKQAQAFINQLHRHHAAAVRDKFRIAATQDGHIVGVVQCGRPVSRVLDDGYTLEVLRLCTDGGKDVCSFLYSRCARIAKEMGYRKIITYILATEPGTSLKASGWTLEDDNCGGATWENCTRTKERPVQLSMIEQKQKYPVGIPKQRWSKEL